MMVTEQERGLQYFESALDAVGRTPLVRLRRVVDEAKCLVLAKVEYVNPGGSVKDRPAVAMLREAEESGLLHAGSTIVEATSGNTGTGLAMAAAIRGYRCILVMPDKMSKEKIDLLRAYGAEVV
jgi:cystathionine beta-synthase